MVKTREEITARPVSLELREGSNVKTYLKCVIKTEDLYEKLFKMTARQAVQYVLTCHEDRENPDCVKLEESIRQGIKKNDDYTIDVVDAMLAIIVNERKQIQLDRREELIINYLKNAVSKGIPAWVAKMRIVYESTQG